MGDDALVCIVDDDESTRKATKRLLQSGGLAVEGFASAEDFLSSGHPQDSACLILDVRLPGISGLELQGLLRASDLQVPIVFITAHGDSQVRIKALERGAVDFLQKPFSEKALFKAISSFVATPITSEDTGSLPKPVAPKFGFDEIVGGSTVLREMLRLRRKVAESGSSCRLLQGVIAHSKGLV